MAGFIYREHRGSLNESMRESKHFLTKKELVESVQNSLDQFFGPLNRIDCSVIEIKPYAYDSRIDWHCHIVTLEGYGVLGFTNKQVED